MADPMSALAWADARGRQWRDQVDGMEATLAPVDAPLIAALRLDGPLDVAEIGCGGGATTRAIASALPAGGTVEGFDISADLVAAARERVGDVARFTVADAGRFLPERRFDRLASRFGIMFFDDPAAAFANLRGWLKPGGRLAFAVWGPGSEVGFMRAVRDGIASVMPVAPPDPDAPGPCRYGDPARLAALLEHAGFADAASTTWRGELPVGGGLPARAAAEFLVASSSTAAPLADADPALRLRALDAIEAACAAHERDGLVRMPVRVEIVTARAG